MSHTLLIVDDHAGFRSSARALLEAAGFVVVGEAGTGGEAIAAAVHLQPDVVLLDVTLPDMDGFAVARMIAEAGPDGPVVVLTSSRALSSYDPEMAAGRPFIGKDDLTGPALHALAAARDD